MGLLRQGTATKPINYSVYDVGRTLLEGSTLKGYDLPLIIPSVKNIFQADNETEGAIIDIATVPIGRTVLVTDLVIFIVFFNSNSGATVTVTDDANNTLATIYSIGTGSIFNWGINDSYFFVLKTSMILTGGQKIRAVTFGAIAAKIAVNVLGYFIK